MVSRDEAWAAAIQHRKELLSCARGRYRLTPEEAEDAVADAMLKAVQGVRDVANIRPALYRALGWVIVDKVRQDQGRRSAIMRQLFASSPGEFGLWTAALLASEETSNDDANKRSLVSCHTPAEFQPTEAIELRDYTERLPRHHAEAIWCDYLRMSAKEAAAALGVTVPSYKAALYRARAALREMLKDDYPFLAQKDRTASEDTGDDPEDQNGGRGT